MDTKSILEKLKEPFPEEDIEWRIGRSGLKDNKIWATCLVYVTNRAIQDRLDYVLGQMNWKNEYKEGPGGGVLCGLSVRIDGEWITKWDGADNTAFESVKGGLSGSMKRAAVMFGIGRYLYNMEEGRAIVNNSGKYYQSENKKTGVPLFKWDPPKLPAWALPKTDHKEPEKKKTSETKKNPTFAPATSEFPEDIKKFFSDKKWNMKAVKEFCQPYDWDWDAIREAQSSFSEMN